VHGDRIEYDETGEKSYRFSMTGDVYANRIKFRFQGTGTEGNSRFGKGEVTLREK